MGLPIYNGAQYLTQTLHALLDQSFEDFTLYIVDNASTDATASISRRFAEQDPRVRYVRNEQNIGAAANFNRAAELASGPYFKWVAHDDLYASTFLESCVDALDANPSAVLAYAETRWIDADDRVLPFDASRQAYVDSHGATYFHTPGAGADLETDDPGTRFRSVLFQRHSTFCHEVYGLMRTAALRRTHRIDAFYGSDRVLLAEMALRGPFRRVSAPLFYRRCHPRQSRAGSTQSQARWITGRTVGPLVFPQGRMFAAYLRAVYAADLSGLDKLRLAGSVLKLATRPDKLKRLILPGPHNYFGLGAPAPSDSPAASAASTRPPSVSPTTKPSTPNPLSVSQ